MHWWFWDAIARHDRPASPQRHKMHEEIFHLLATEIRLVNRNCAWLTNSRYDYLIWNLNIAAHASLHIVASEYGILLKAVATTILSWKPQRDYDFNATAHSVRSYILKCYESEDTSQVSNMHLCYSKMKSSYEQQASHISRNKNGYMKAIKYDCYDYSTSL